MEDEGGGGQQAARLNGGFPSGDPLAAFIWLNSPLFGPID
jgi:hypothetical protein